MASALRGVAGDGAGGHVTGGANALRGGKRTYSSKTLEGGWYEDRAAPGFGGVRPEARTEEASRQAAVTGRHIPVYGAAILDAEERAAGTKRYDPTNTLLPDTHARPAGWRSTASASFRPAGEEGDAELAATGTTFRPKHHPMTADARRLAGYRERWLNHAGEANAQRFRTTADDALSAPVAERHRVPHVRALPGVPKSLEALRERMVTSKGLQALVLLRRAFAAMDASGDGALSREELRGGLGDFGVSLSVDEFNELFRFLDADRSGAVSWAELVAVLTGALRTPAGAAGAEGAPQGALATPELPATRAAAVDEAWAAVADRAGGAASVPAAWLRRQMDAASFPDAASGLRDAESVATLLLEPATGPVVAALPPAAGRRARQEAADNCAVGPDGFRAVHRAWSVLVPLEDDFRAIVASLWRVPVPGAAAATAAGDAAAGPASTGPAGGTSSGGGVCKVLVTHSGSGRKTVEDVPMGPFFDREDHAAIIRQLRGLGIAAASVSLDF